MNSLWFKAVKHSNIGLIKLMLQNGADPNIKDNSGYTALHVTSIYRYNEAIKLLLQNSADPDIKNTRNRTALYKTVVSKYKDIADLLKQYGAKE